MKFKQALAKKEIFYKKISRFFMFAMYEKYKNIFCKTKNIQIIGTNGKGSTGRFLAMLLKQEGFLVGHYTSPHIFKFNERFWLNGAIVNDESLEQAHKILEDKMKQDLSRLSYFEYATFLALVLFEKCDYVVFEAGVGGEYDATSIFDKELTIFTNIGFDHQELLGKTLKNIARTKLKAMKYKAIISSNQDLIVLNLAKHIALLKNSKLTIASFFQDKDLKNITQEYTKKHNLAYFLQDNLLLALESFSIILNKDKAGLIKSIQNLSKLDLKGRCEQISDNIFVDVGHNEMAALALASIFKEKKVHLVYNCFMDKDFHGILKALKPIIKIVEIYDYETGNRPLAGEKLIESLRTLGIKYKKFDHIKNDNLYLVFGSFLLVENFLRGHRER
ncbi:bifunctional folylpolyglutamate synthase/dihydrofolate synthase [Campylobacter volucris]|uniref:Bifunctional folylpolyglutamate synthase/dihydrofolate synthase n=1 Tax=Campylobacter volucris TaxID=1031542 RepID=A0A5C7E6J0_9BACT|nr:Mur ligase family protein [Campylobacter volucris]TXE89338.1 bifunctional folylpolyglutamate synthase/dihydrofolate synthase [Campylobacter volucris]